MRSNTANNCTDDDDGTGLRRGIIFGCEYLAQNF